MRSLTRDISRKTGALDTPPGMVNLSPGLCDRRLVCGIRLMNTPALTDRYKPTLSL